MADNEDFDTIKQQDAAFRFRHHKIVIFIHILTTRKFLKSLNNVIGNLEKYNNLFGCADLHTSTTITI